MAPSVGRHAKEGWVGVLVLSTMVYMSYDDIGDYATLNHNV